jgi:hypothetical protein
VDGRVTYQWDTSKNLVFGNNIFHGNHAEIPPDPFAITARPALRNPGSGGDGFDSLNGYRPSNSSVFPRGRIIPDNGGRDFFGNAVPSDQPPCIGAAEMNPQP